MNNKRKEQLMAEGYVWPMGSASVEAQIDSLSSLALQARRNAAGHEHGHARGYYSGEESGFGFAAAMLAAHAGLAMHVWEYQWAMRRQEDAA